VVPFDVQVGAAVRWLAVYTRPGRASGAAWSYRWVKHLVQAWAGHYVSSAAVVAAATAAGLAMVGTRTRAGNAWLALSVRRHQPEHSPSTGGLNEA
jgi:type IV secretory pathway VirB2 component (pilin)